MKVEEMIGYAVDDVFECEIWDCDDEEVLYEGWANELPSHFLDARICSWELNEGVLIFNVSFADITLILP